MPKDVNELQQQIKEQALERINASFAYDEFLDAIAKGDVSPKRGQLEAIKLIFDRSHKLMDFHIGKPVQEQKQSGEIKLVISSDREGIFVQTTPEPVGGITATNAI